LKKEEDPLWDENKPTLLGYCFYKLEPLAYLMTNQFTCSIISTSGLCVGNLTVDIIPHDEDGNEFDEIPDDPNELIGQPLSFKVYIKDCKDLPDNFCRAVQIEYVSFVDNIVYKSKVNEEKNKYQEFEEYFPHHIDYITKDDVDYFLKEKVDLF
jgi:hypothetical protein